MPCVFFSLFLQRITANELRLYIHITFSYPILTPLSLGLQLVGIEELITDGNSSANQIVPTNIIRNVDQ